eukprot:g16407.t1
MRTAGIGCNSSRCTCKKNDHLFVKRKVESRIHNPPIDLQLEYLQGRSRQMFGGCVSGYGAVVSGRSVGRVKMKKQATPAPDSEKPSDLNQDSGNNRLDSGQGSGQNRLELRQASEDISLALSNTRENPLDLSEVGERTVLQRDNSTTSFDTLDSSQDSEKTSLDVSLNSEDTMVELGQEREKSSEVPPEREPREVFVGGIAWNTTNESLSLAFSQFGDILKSKIIRDTASGAARGYGFVKFQEASSAARAVAASHWLTLDGRRIDCKFALPTVAGGQHVRKLFVGGLPREANAHTLKKHFQKYGKVINAVVMLDRNTGLSRGFGFVTMHNNEAIQTILSTPQVMRGRRIDVHKALSRDQMEQRERVSEVAMQQQHHTVYWPAANYSYIVGSASPAGVASPSGAKLGMPMYGYTHPANVNLSPPKSPPPHSQLGASSSPPSPGSLPISPISPGVGVFYSPPWAHLPYPYPPAHGHSPQSMHMSYLYMG